MSQEINKSEEPKHGLFKGFLKSFWGEVIQTLVISAIIIVPFRMYIAQPFMVSGPSMDNTFHDGQYLIVDELTYHSRDPHRGEVVIFKYPVNPKLYFIKRVIGLPNETVEIKDGIIKIFNTENPNGFTLTENYVKSDAGGLIYVDMKKTLKDNEYFVLGDNRGVSSDSRVWGPVNRDLITGRPFLRLLPFNSLSVWPGQVIEAK